jgi:hypothetical protein
VQLSAHRAELLLRFSQDVEIVSFYFAMSNRTLNQQSSRTIIYCTNDYIKEPLQKSSEIPKGMESMTMTITFHVNRKSSTRFGLRGT